jgi:hydroxymethylbilane synthase
VNGKTIYVATRGSALALAHSNLVLAQCERNFPGRKFELKIIKTTGDKLQAINLTNPNQELTRGLFTKELEIALLNGEADFAVHSLKDLPTELPAGLFLGGVSAREDARDVLIYRDANQSGKNKGYGPHAQISDFHPGSTIATSSTRRQAQLLAVRPDLRTVPVRGNVGTRIRKLWESEEFDAIILALAGLKRLGYRALPSGELEGSDVPAGTRSTILPMEQMLPCVGQAALGFEARIDDPIVQPILRALNHEETRHCVISERAFLRGMGGGCLSPVAAYAEIKDGQLHLRAVSFRDEKVRRAEISGPVASAEALGRAAAENLSR